MTQRARHTPKSRVDADKEAHRSLVALARLLARQAARREFTGRHEDDPDARDQDNDDEQ